MPMTGEEVHARGAQGSERAKRWLEGTCRADVHWINPSLCPEKLKFDKAIATPDHPATFSFDLGGILRGGEEEGKVFLAEVKFYRRPNDQGTQYPLFLSKCYRVEDSRPNAYDRYLWITWAPFLSSSWHLLLSSGYVGKSVGGSTKGREIALGEADPSDDVVSRVALKLIVVVLSADQEKVLSLNGSELIEVRKALIASRIGQ